MSTDKPGADEPGDDSADRSEVVGDPTTALSAGEATGPGDAWSRYDDPAADAEPDPPAEVDPETLPKVPGVRIEAQIGRGGFATVYRGHQMSVDRDVAVKVDDRRLADARDRRRFTREIIAAGAVSGHPHIVTLYDGGTTSTDHPYLVMELYPGGSYAERMKRSGSIPVTEVTDVGFAIADALVAAHEEGILHRDVKPGNILISRYGSPGLTDFGLAALPPAGESYSVTMDSLTPSYAAPEAFGGAEPTVSMDIYALGATLYAMLLGRPPRSDVTGASPPLTKLLLLLNDPLPPAPVPGAAELMPVIWRATAVDPKDRYATAADFRDDLAQVRAGHPDRAHGLRPFATVPLDSADATVTGLSSLLDPTPSTDTTGSRTGGDVEPGRASSRSRWWLAAAAAVAVAAVAAGVFLRPTATGVAGPGTVSGAGTSEIATTSAPTSSDSSVEQSPPPTSVENTGPTTASVSALPTAVISTPARAGDCFSRLTNVNGRWAGSRVACDQPHVWESYAVGELDPTTPSSYINDVSADPAVGSVCTDLELKTFLSGAGGTYNKIELGPTQDEFVDGKRQFWCLAKEFEAGEVTGSLRDGG